MRWPGIILRGEIVTSQAIVYLYIWMFKQLLVKIIDVYKQRYIQAFEDLHIANVSHLLRSGRRNNCWLDMSGVRFASCVIENILVEWLNSFQGSRVKTKGLPSILLTVYRGGRGIMVFIGVGQARTSEGKPHHEEGLCDEGWHEC